MEKRINIISKELGLSDIRPVARAIWIFAFAVLTAISAQIEIPNQPVPFTFQTLFVLLAGAVLGEKSGATSMLLYILLGIVGLPVFSASGLGLSRIIGPTGGYILSFPVAAFAVGYLVRIRKEFWWMLISMIIGSVLVLLIGTVQLNMTYLHNWTQSFISGFLIFSLWDGVKILGAATIAYYYFKSTNSQ